MAKHFPLGVGTRIAFVGETGETSHYSIKAETALTSCDIMVGLLDYELTPDVHPAKILPADFEKRFPKGSRCPLFMLNQHEQAYLSEIRFYYDPASNRIRLENHMQMTELGRKYGGKIISGDSGGPAFLLYRDKPIFLFCLHIGGTGHGPQIHEHRDEVQRAMDDLCPGYQLEGFVFPNP